MPYPRFPREPEPDFARLAAVLGRGAPDRVPFIELGIDHPVLEAVREAPFSGEPRLWRREFVEVWRRLGYDYCPVGAQVALPRRHLMAEDTAGLAMAQRSWVDEAHGTIETWRDFEQYPWPRPEQVDYSFLEDAAAALPEGMKIIFLGPGGVLENVMWLMGYQPMSYAMADDPDLVEAMFARIGELLVGVFEAVAGHEAVGALWLGDDMGHKTQTLISPEALRRWVFPWQRRLAQIAHARGKPFLLHACGNLEAVMEDLIEEVGVDAKHSFEDVIEPAEEAKRRWGDRIAILGGVDVDVLARGTPERVRERTRGLLEACMPGGGYALGSGNTVANYVPVGNYLAMLEEGWQVGVYGG